MFSVRSIIDGLSVTLRPELRLRRQSVRQVVVNRACMVKFSEQSVSFSCMGKLTVLEISQPEE